MKNSIALLVMALSFIYPNFAILKEPSPYGVSPEDMEKAISAPPQPEKPPQAEKPQQAEKADKANTPSMQNAPSPASSTTPQATSNTPNPITQKTTNGNTVNQPVMQTPNAPGKIGTDSANTGRTIQKEPNAELPTKNNGSPKEFIEEPPSGNSNKSPTPPQATTPDSKSSKEAEKPIDTYIRGY